MLEMLPRRREMFNYACSNLTTVHAWIEEEILIRLEQGRYQTSTPELDPQMDLLLDPTREKRGKTIDGSFQFRDVFFVPKIQQFKFITRRPFWSPWGIKALSLHCLCPSSLTLNERFHGQNLLFGHRVIWVYRPFRLVHFVFPIQIMW